jgi:hypothetical protein
MKTNDKPLAGFAPLYIAAQICFLAAAIPDVVSYCQA